MREIYVPGRGPVLFPDSMSNDDIKSIIQSKMLKEGSSGEAKKEKPLSSFPEKIQSQKPEAATSQAAEEEGLLDKAARYAGLGLRGAAKAVATPGLMVADGMVAGLEALTGIDTKSSPSALFEKKFLDPALPKPEGFIEKLGVDVAEAVSGAGLAKAATKGVVAAGKELTPGIRTALNNIGESKSAAALSATAASTASQVAENAGVGDGGQAAAGLVAGVLAPTSGQYLAGVGRGLVRPYTQNGKQEIVGELINEVATDRQAALRNLEEAAKRPSIVPDSFRTTSGASKDAGIASLETPIRSAFDTSNRISDRLTKNNAARVAIGRRIAGDEQDVINAKVLRDDQTDPMRESAFENAKRFYPDDLMASIKAEMQAPGKRREVVDEAYSFIERRMSKIRDDEFGTVDPLDLYGIRQDLKEAMEGKLGKDRADFRLARKEVSTAIRKIDDELEGMAPGYKDYMRTYAQKSRPIEEKEALQEIFKGGITRRDAIDGEDWLSGPKLEGALEGVIKRDGRVLSDKAKMRVQAIIDDIEENNAGSKPGMNSANSSTVKNLSTASFLSRALPTFATGQSGVGGVLRGLTSWIHKIPEAKVQELMVEAMLDPAIAANLMRKADKATVKRTMEQLRVKASSIGIGTYAGSNDTVEQEEER